ncbi:MAG: tRNA pseudouridine(55) synthase TruB [Oscillospiraceae bacterium]|nr:tRNA pseudouridine(55) synthase TruB [Oscillospiraceae bacterium]
MNGIIIVDKHEGITSFGIVSKIRGILGQKKAGHTGTLDPMATGVLPVMLGGATKFCELLPTRGKAYRAELLLGVTTDTLDVTGVVLREKSVDVALTEVEAALKGFVGRISQVPPMYSAVSKDGVRLYKLARQGIEVEREARQVEIYAANILSADMDDHKITIDVRCSAGTYIRSLAHDLGEALGCGAVLSALRRTSANGFCDSGAKTVAQIESIVKSGGAESLIVPVDQALAAYPEIQITANQSVRFRNGGALDAARLTGLRTDGLYRVYAPDGVFLGLGEKKQDSGELSVKRGMRG